MFLQQFCLLLLQMGLLIEIFYCVDEENVLPLAVATIVTVVAAGVSVPAVVTGALAAARATFFGCCRHRSLC